jgi:hypothetical protein
MNNIMMAHIGTELVVIAGVAYYYHRRTSSLQQEVDILKTQNLELVEAIKGLGEDMNKLYSMIRGSVPQPAQPTHAGTTAQQPKSSKKKSPPKKNKQAKKISNVDTEDETLDDEDLDEMLRDDYKELKNLNRPVKGKPIPKSQVKVEECVDETCSLID